MDDPYLYSVEHVKRQAASAVAEQGVYPVRFYARDGRPARENTGVVERFYYYPSGGTIRDAQLNILLYEPRLDQYHPSNRDG